MGFESRFEVRGPICFPKWTGVRVQLMPIVMHDLESIPPFLRHWKGAIVDLFEQSLDAHGVGYLTIDERFVAPGISHRRPGLHIDGMGAWGNGGHTAGARGMLTASNVEGCAAWRQGFLGLPRAAEDAGDPNEGDCEHLRAQCLDDNRVVLKASKIYFCEQFCVHESLPILAGGHRIFVRLSMPSNAPWPANCTPNPLGILPTGPISEPRRTVGEYAYQA